jgi:hypothetical protein
MNRWRVGEDRGSKEMDGCPLTKGKKQLSIMSAMDPTHLSGYILSISGFMSVLCLIGYGVWVMKGVGAFRSVNHRLFKMIHFF